MATLRQVAKRARVSVGTVSHVINGKVPVSPDLRQRVEEAIVEGPSKKDPEVLSGRTRQGKLVHFPPPARDDLAPGTFVGVRVYHAAPHHLSGTLVSVEKGPARRVGKLIPVAAC